MNVISARKKKRGLADGASLESETGYGTGDEPSSLSGRTREAMQSEDDFRKFIQARHWRFAKTMPQWSHEYTVRKFEDPQEDQAAFEQAVAFIRELNQC